jgi:hypothetical protein
MNQQADMQRNSTRVVPMNNPYATKPKESAPVQGMGPQSQRQNSLQERTYKLASNTKKRKGGQLTLFGETAFDPSKDCPVCKGRLAGRDVHRSHDPCCTNNRRTQGITSVTTLQQLKEDKRLEQLYKKPLTESEKGSWRYSTKEAGEKFFARRTNIWRPEKTITNNPPPMTTPTEGDKIPIEPPNAEDMCSWVTTKVNDPKFIKKEEKNTAPLAMLAFASWVMEKIVNKGLISSYFDGMAITVPPADKTFNSPHYHSIVGSKLLLVDWEKTFGLIVSCPACHQPRERANEVFKEQATLPNLRIERPSNVVHGDATQVSRL